MKWVLSTPSMCDHRLSLMLAPLATFHFASCGIQPWHLPFMKPRKAMLTFSPRVLATRDFASRRVELSFHYLMNPQDVRGQ
jgi:hypothetical protein